ncbi:hypothetical protein CASFOL_018042 [Castilleja foliolosa]|uniref:Uncharacterized protein n=1 Tax=Castilleja foliolosa TaxID=1961234 RepID=A0ABD3D854_9LAMI
MAFAPCIGHPLREVDTSIRDVVKLRRKQLQESSQSAETEPRKETLSLC